MGFADLLYLVKDLRGCVPSKSLEAGRVAPLPLDGVDGLYSPGYYVY